MKHFSDDARLKISGMTVLLEQIFKPVLLNIDDESAQHAGHLPGTASEGTHLSVDIVSEAFEGKSLVERHQMVYRALEEFFTLGLHALKIKAATPNECKI